MNTLALEQVESWSGPPLVLFVGVNTAGSLVHAVFDHWAALLGRPWVLRGVDLPSDTSAESYRRLVIAVRDNPVVHGAVITAHKVRLYRACAGDLRQHDELVGITREVNTLSAAGGGVHAYARDALSLTRILPTAPNVLCLGAGGAGRALLLALHRSHATTSAVFADTDPNALEGLRAVAVRAGIDPARLSLVSVRSRDECDALVAGLPEPALVVNATGLGKDAPGSPVTDQAPFSSAMLAWDFNYRGTLTFLHQAAALRASTMDGWDYFIAGWAGALTAIAEMPFTDDILTQFGQVAAPYRP